MMPYPERLTAVFEAALLREPAEREAYLREACEGDARLRQQVEAMLVDVERPALIDSPVGEAVVELLGDDGALMIGKRLGPYQVDSLLGAGGMGEVYRATDTVLSRHVAIKLLPADLARDPERVARFRREARILASLNHPNVAAIYGVEALEGEHGPSSALVLELVEGPTLSDKLTPGAMPLDEALAVAGQTADALDAAHQLVDTGSPRGPFSSPDGEWVGFIETGTSTPEIRKVSITGGPTVLIVPFTGLSTGVTWGDDDSIVFATGDPTTGLLRVSSAGGTPEVLTRPDRERGDSDHVRPHYLPGSKAVLFTIASAKGDSQLAALDLRSGVIKTLLPGSQPHYTSSGHLVYLSMGTLMAVRFNADRLEVSGPSIPVTSELITLASGTAEFDIARDGTLAYLQGDGPERTLVWVDHQGREEPVKSDRPRAYTNPRLSPDNTRVAAAVGDADRDIWVLNLASGAATRATVSPGTDSVPLWLDDRQIAYTSRAPGDILRVLRRNADATGQAEPLSQETLPPMVMTSLAPGRGNARGLLGTTILGPSDVGLLTLSDGRFRPLLHDAYIERNAAVSPDGRFVAYETNAEGVFQIKVRPFPDVDSGQWSVSQEGFQPAWALDGSALFYRAADGAMMRVPVRPGPTWNAGLPTRLFDGGTFFGAMSTGSGYGRTYDVAKDGRFLMVKEPAPDRAPSISMVVVQNWFEELKRLVP